MSVSKLQRFTLSLPMSAHLSPEASILSFAAFFRALTHAPMSFLPPQYTRTHASPHTPPHPFLSSPCTLVFSRDLDSLPLPSVIHALSFPSSFLPDYISGDFDSITAEVKAFFSHKVSATQLNCTHVSAPPAHFRKDAQIEGNGDFRQTSFQKFELQNFTRLRDQSQTATIPFNADSPPRLLAFLSSAKVLSVCTWNTCTGLQGDSDRW